MKSKAISIRVISILLLMIIRLTILAQTTHHPKENSSDEPLAYPIDLAQQLRVFDDGVTDAYYFISLCADVPYDRKPLRVAHNQQTGHVFLIFRKIHDGDTVSKVFGFYPKNGLPTLFFKRIKSKIKDNSGRIYDADVTRKISASAFDTALAKAIIYSKHIYHINRFNCYDYAVEIFNSIAGKDTVPLTHVRFPTIFGRGGSPCGVYRDLTMLKEKDPMWTASIRFGQLRAPMSTVFHGEALSSHGPIAQ
jgi:hypothetical protein